MTSSRRTWGWAFALSAAWVAGVAVGGCKSNGEPDPPPAPTEPIETTTPLQPSGTLADDPRINRPGLFEVRRGGPTGPLVAVVWRLDQPQGKIVYDGTMWPIQPGDVEIETGRTGPSAAGMCGEAAEMSGDPIVATWYGGLDPLTEMPELFDEEPCE